MPKNTSIRGVGKGIFSLTPISFLNIFEEIATNSNTFLNSCLKDNIIVISTPPIQSLKRKFDDANIKAYLGTTSTWKPKE